MEAQLKPAQFVEWLFFGGREYGIPEEVIQAQAERHGYKVEPIELAPEPTPEPTPEPAKRGRKPKEQK